MKNGLIIFSLCFVTGCSSYKVKGYEGPEVMNRMEVIQAARECIRAKMKPNTEYLVTKTDAGKVLVPVNVHCD
jgi:hypothetical protein